MRFYMCSEQFVHILILLFLPIMSIPRFEIYVKLRNFKLFFLTNPGMIPINCFKMDGGNAFH